MRLSRTLALLLGALATTAGVSAASARSQNTSAAVTTDDLDNLLARAVPLAQANKCPELLALLDPVLPRVIGTARNSVQLLRIACLPQVGRESEIQGIYREMASIDPADGAVQSVGVVVAAVDGDSGEAGKRLIALADSKPAALSAISGVVVRNIAQDLTQKDLFPLRDRMFVALARADFQPIDRPDMRDSLSQNAIYALLSDNRIDEARSLLPRIIGPELLSAMATERHYQPIWSDIEERLGPHGGEAIDRFALSGLDAYAAAPADPRAMRDAIRSYVLLGRYSDAVDLGEQVKIAEGMGENEVASVYYHAEALQAQGQVARAIAGLKPFTSLDVAKSPDVVTGLVGYAEVLDENGREAEALSVARAAAAQSGTSISSWGLAWLRRTEICSLAAMGRAAEAAPLAETTIAKLSDNRPAAVESMLCLGRTGEAARIAIDTMATAEGASTIVDQFQPEGSLWAPAASRLRALWMPLLARPDVKAAFEKVGRILPKSFWPVRVPRAIPRRIQGDTNSIA